MAGSLKDFYLTSDSYYEINIPLENLSDYYLLNDDIPFFYNFIYKYYDVELRLQSLIPISNLLILLVIS